MVDCFGSYPAFDWIFVSECHGQGHCLRYRADLGRRIRHSIFDSAGKAKEEAKEKTKEKEKSGGCPQKQAGGEKSTEAKRKAA